MRHRFRTFAIAALVLAPSAAAAQHSQLPFLADDLNPGERLFTRDHAAGIQALGYDFSGRRILPNGTWTSLRRGGAPDRNDGRIIYDKPFYAMEDGEVEACWRNAPENPRPGERHPAQQDGLVPGGGNMLWLRLADGSRVLYAHAIPGTIPPELCPHNEELLSAPGAREGVVPEGQRAQVRAGQFLGRVGNSGSSSGPHLHIHRELGGSAHPITFERGLSTPWNNARADINDWRSFAGRSIPNGAVLIWPPRRLGSEYTRHRFNPADYGRLFDHLVDSGFKPVWFDGYSVGGDVRYNFVWRPADRPFRAYRGLTGSQYQDRFVDAVGDGFAPVFVESYLSNGNIRYAFIAERNRPGRFMARHNMTLNQHRTAFREARSAGLRPTSVSVVSPNGQRRYTVLYRQEPIGSWRLHSRIRASDFQEMFDTQRAAGRLPRYVAAYMHDGTAFFSVVFSSTMSGSATFHGLTSGAFQSRFNDQTGAGRGTRVVTGYDGARRNHRFVGVWR